MSPALWWTGLTVPAGLVSVWLGIRTVRSLIRTMRASVVASAPLRERQILPLPGAGSYDLYMEGKRLSRDFGGLDFALSDRSGATIPVRRLLLRTQVSSLSRVRLALRSFDVDAEGDVVLTTSGIRPARRIRRIGSWSHARSAPPWSRTCWRCSSCRPPRSGRWWGRSCWRCSRAARRLRRNYEQSASEQSPA